MKLEHSNRKLIFLEMKLLPLQTTRETLLSEYPNTIYALHNDEYIPPDFHTTGLTRSETRRKIFWKRVFLEGCVLHLSLFYCRIAVVNSASLLRSFFDSVEVYRYDQRDSLVAICEFLYSIPHFDCCHFSGSQFVERTCSSRRNSLFLMMDDRNRFSRACLVDNCFFLIRH